MVNLNNLINKKIGKEKWQEFIQSKWSSETLLYLQEGKLSETKQREFNEADLYRFHYGQPERYLNNIIKGWMCEDFIYLLFKDKAEEFELNNKDKDREFIFNSNFSLNELDFKIKKNDKTFFADSVSDFTGYCIKNQSISLMFEKANKFTKDDLLFILDVKNEKIGIIKPYFCKKEKVVLNEKDNFYKYEVFFNYEKFFKDIK